MSLKQLSLPSKDEWIPKYNNLGEFVINYMKLHKNKIAQIDAETEETVTYGLLLKKVINVAKQMTAYGLKQNDVISICSRNSLKNFLPVYASFILGIKSASLDPSLSLNETTHLINLVKPKMVFCEIESTELIKNALESLNLKDTMIIVFGSYKNFIPFSQFLNNEKEDEFETNYSFKQQKLDDVAIIMFSSGSTGLPKGICLSHYGLLYQVAISASTKPLNININFASTYWISTILLTLSSLLKGATRVLSSNFNVERCLNYVEKYEITSLILSATYSHAFLQNSGILKKYNLSSLKYVSTAGSPFSVQHMNQLRDLFSGATVLNNYGMTEISGLAVAFNIFDNGNIFNKKDNSCGVPLPGIHLKVVDLESGDTLGPNKIGELCIKSRCLFKGYYNNASDYDKQFDKEGYFSTGDIVYYDNDFCFYVVDRIKDMFKFQSWHITPISIESILLTHPCVKDAVVIGLPHETDGEHPLGIVTLQSNSSIDPQELINFVEERVSDRQKLRGGLKILKEIPKSPSGKLKRLALRQMLKNGEI